LFDRGLVDQEVVVDVQAPGRPVERLKEELAGVGRRGRDLDEELDVPTAHEKVLVV
jgi:hypothetical protein